MTLRKDILILLLALLGGTILAALITPKGIAFFGYSSFAMDIPRLLERPEPGVGRALLLSQGLYSLCMFFLPALFLYQRWKRTQSIPELPTPIWTGWDTLFAWVLLPASLPALNAANELWLHVCQNWPWMEVALADQAHGANMVERMLFLPSWGDTVSAFTVFVVWAAFTEELLFRGVIQRILHAGRPAKWAILGGALAFALGHLNFVQWPFLLGAGLILGSIYALSGRLWVSFGAHLLHNAMTYFWTMAAGPGAYGTLDAPFSWPLTLGSSSVAAAAAWALWVRYRRTLTTN